MTIAVEWDIKPRKQQQQYQQHQIKYSQSKRSAYNLENEFWKKKKYVTTFIGDFINALLGAFRSFMLQMV